MVVVFLLSTALASAWRHGTPSIRIIVPMDAPIVGTEALAGGALTRGQLRWNYRSIFPNVYIPKSASRSLELMTIGAWLWSERRATITGRAAAALHGAQWVDECAPIEMLW